MPDSGVCLRKVLSFSVLSKIAERQLFTPTEIEFIHSSLEKEEEQEETRVCSTQKYSVIVIAREIVRITLVRV